MKPNPNLEIRNNLEYQKKNETLFFFGFRDSDFEFPASGFVSDFDIRISDFESQIGSV
jgi:hypothetical protein